MTELPRGLEIIANSNLELNLNHLGYFCVVTIKNGDQCGFGEYLIASNDKKEPLKCKLHEWKGYGVNDKRIRLPYCVDNLEWDENHLVARIRTRGLVSRLRRGFDGNVIEIYPTIEDFSDYSWRARDPIVDLVSVRDYVEKWREVNRIDKWF